MTSENLHIRIERGNENNIDMIHAYLQEDFPPEELITLSHFKDIYNKGKYVLYLVKDKTSNDLVGYFTLFLIDDLKFIWLDYIAILKSFRGQGYGSLILKELFRMNENKYKGVFIEVEHPDENDSIHYLDQCKRVSFYERLGAEHIPLNYRLPRGEVGLPLRLYFKTLSGTEMISAVEIKGVIESVFEYTHLDVENRHMIYEQFVDEILSFRIENDF